MALEDGKGIAFSAPARCPFALRNLDNTSEADVLCCSSTVPLLQADVCLPLKMLCLQ
jgi:hypothetical protein